MIQKKQSEKKRMSEIFLYKYSYELRQSWQYVTEVS